METENLGKFSIKSTILLQGTLKCSLAKVKERMNFYPSLKLASEGSELEYVLNHSDESRHYLLRISRNGIYLTAFSNVSPEYFEKEHLLRLFNFAQILSDLYVFEMGSIFPAIMHFLSYDIKYHSNKISTQNGREVELLLSKRIVDLHKKNEELYAELEQSKAIVIRLLAKILAHEDFKGSQKEVVEMYKVSPEIAEKALFLREELKEK